MKKILMTIAMLAMILPTFGQKLNSRGEKMVSSIYVYNTQGKVSNHIEFEYDKDGSLSCIKYGTITIQKRGDKLYYNDSYSDDYGTQPSVRTFELNSNGLIISCKQIFSPQEYILREYAYEYNKALGRNVRTARRESSWFINNNGQPRLCDGQYNNVIYEYRDGNPYITYYVSLYGKSQPSGTINIVYGNDINDTNIDFPQLLQSNAFPFELTEWCPIYNGNLPISYRDNKGQMIKRYEYDYYNGSIVCIRSYFRSSAGNKNLDIQGAITKINYVED